jgi:hypothetical protein
VELEITKKGDGVPREGTAVQFAWLDSLLRSYPMSALREVLSASADGYRSWQRGGTAQRTRHSVVDIDPVGPC